MEKGVYTWEHMRKNNDGLTSAKPRLFVMSLSKDIHQVKRIDLRFLREFECAVLPVEGEVVDVDGAGGAEDGGR